MTKTRSDPETRATRPDTTQTRATRSDTTQTRATRPDTTQTRATRPSHDPDTCDTTQTRPTRPRHDPDTTQTRATRPRHGRHDPDTTQTRPRHDPDFKYLKYILTWHASLTETRILIRIWWRGGVVHFDVSAPEFGQIYPQRSTLQQSSPLQARSKKASALSAPDCIT